MINKNEAKLEISMIFVQPSSRLMYFLMGWLLVLGLKDCLVKCATVCVRSMVILKHMDGARDIFWIKTLNGTFLALQIKAFGPKKF